MPEVVKRFSLLRRRSPMDRERFLAHYEGVHGPLAAAQDGFRQFAYRYVQNHVLDGDGAGIDGISVTYQKPRADYRRGFFQHPDYANVRADEEYLFDTAATVSLLGRERIVCRRGDGGEKAIFLVRRGDTGVAADVTADGAAAPPDVRKAICNSLDAGSASALGLGEATAPWHVLWEIWFASQADRQRACRDRTALGALSPALADDGTVALAVREVVFFTGEP
jgi:hypothetical protein